MKTFWTLTVAAAILVGCYGGKGIPDKKIEQKSDSEQILAQDGTGVSGETITGENGTAVVAPTVVDDPKVVKEVQTLIDSINTGLNSAAQAAQMEKELTKIRTQVKSPELLTQIDTALAAVRAELIAFQSEAEIQKSIAEATSQFDQHIKAVNEFKLKLNSQKKVEETINQINELMAQNALLVSNLIQLKESVEKKGGFETEIQAIEQKITALKEKEAELKATLDQAIAQKTEIIGKEQAEAQLTQKTETIRKEIGTLMAEVSLEFDQNKLNLLTSLIQGIPMVTTAAELGNIKDKIQELERYVLSVLSYLQEKKGEVQALIAKLENLYKEALNLGYSQTDILSAYLYSLKEVNLDKDINNLSGLLGQTEQAYKNIALRDKTIKELALKQALENEFQALQTQAAQTIAYAQAPINQLQQFFQQKAALEAKVVKGKNLIATDLNQVKALSEALNGINLKDILSNLSALKKQLANFGYRSGTYLPSLNSLLQQITVLEQSVKTLVQQKQQTFAALPTLKSKIEQAITDSKKLKKEKEEKEKKENSNNGKRYRQQKQKEVKTNNRNHYSQEKKEDKGKKNSK